MPKAKLPAPRDLERKGADGVDARRIGSTQPDVAKW